MPPSTSTTRNLELNYCRNKKQLRLLGNRVQKGPKKTVHGQQLDHDDDDGNKGRKNNSGMFPSLLL